MVITPLLDSKRNPGINVKFLENLENCRKIDDHKIAKILTNLVDMSPRGIREHLKLNKPIYVPTSAYGHFGRVPDECIDGAFSWEKTDLVHNILKEI